MLKSFKTYYKAAAKSSKTAVIKEKNGVRCFLYLIMSFFGKLFILFRPIIGISNIRVGENTLEHQNFYLLDSFEDGFKEKKYKKVLGSFIFKIGLFIGGIIIGCIITGILASIGYCLGLVLNDLDVYIGTYLSLGYDSALPLCILTGGIGAIGIIIFIILFIIYTSGVTYILDKNDDVEVISAFVASYKTFKKEGKGLITKNFIRLNINLIINIVLTSIPYIAILVLNQTLIADYIKHAILTIGIIYTVFMLRRFARHIVTYLTCKTYIFKEIIYIPSTKVDAPKGLKIQRIASEKLDTVTISSSLEGLFKEDDDRYKESEETLSTLLSNRVSTKKNKLVDVDYIKEEETPTDIEFSNEETNKDEEDDNLDIITETTKKSKKLSKRQLRKIKKFESKKKDKKEESSLPKLNTTFGQSTLSDDQEVNEEIIDKVSGLNEFNKIEKPLSRKEAKLKAKEEKELKKQEAKQAKLDAKASKKAKKDEKVNEEPSITTEENKETVNKEVSNEIVTDEEKVDSTKKNEEVKEEIKTEQSNESTLEVKEEIKEPVEEESRKERKRKALEEKLKAKEEARKKKDKDLANQIKDSQKVDEEVKEENENVDGNN